MKIVTPVEILAKVIWHIFWHVRPRPSEKSGRVPPASAKPTEVA
jgi:hypothetical protein